MPDSSSLPGVYEIYKPAKPLPLVFDSPHSGRIYPEDFGFSCPQLALEKAEDRYVDALFMHVPDYGGAFMHALFPRSYIDANRAADDIDTKILVEPWTHGKIKPTARSEAGIGLIRRLVSPGVPVYDRKLTPDEIRNRIETYYHPYHAALREMLDEAYNLFGQVWHVNCHSMPSRTRLAGKLYTDKHGHLPDFVVGDRGGSTCNTEFSYAIFTFLRDKGFSVTMNEPYRGVELVRKYSNPLQGRHSVQIEVNRALYLDEASNEFHENAAALVEILESLTRFISGYVSSNLVQMAAD